MGRTLELNDYFGSLNDGGNWFDGCMFGSPGVAYTPCNPDIVFSEINYNSSLLKDAGDWVELHNTTGTAINLNGYTLKDSKDSNIFFFPAAVTLPAYGYREVVQDNNNLLPVIRPLQVSTVLSIWIQKQGRSHSIVRCKWKI